MPIFEVTRRLGLSRSSVLAMTVCLSAAAMTYSGHARAQTKTQANTQSGTEPAAAPTAEVKQKAMGHFETGLRLYEDGDFSLALIEFERAYSYIPDYRVLYNIGQVSIQLGRYARAAQALEQYLQRGGKGVPIARANSVRDDLKMLEGRTAHLQVQSNVDAAEVLLDDVRIAVTPVANPVLVDAGEHRLTLQKSGYISRTERLVLAGRDEIQQQMDLTEVPKSAPVAAQPAVAQPHTLRPIVDAPPASQPMSARTQWLYIGAGATGLFTIGWAITGYLGIKAAGDLHDTLQGPTTQGKLDSLRSNARSALLASDILGAAALATGATTLYFALSGPGEKSTRDQPRKRETSRLDRLGVHVAPTTILVTGSF